MFLKYSRTEDLLGQNQKDVMKASESLFLLPFRKIFLDEQLPTIMRRVALSKLREKIKKS